ncbi:non-ribosomal peptide synthetase [Pyxidicoccus trucidator]|uniref:non-ribosomal peptide synthetase n=1 Tax=Pyxidicoccus trucidator TaxID=2709662 RepID=UPI0013DB03D6|nr:non-ribosomal peptide synthetase [Pyxidicoccus trucidator]
MQGSLKDRLAALSPEQRQQLALLLKQQGSVSSNTLFPLSENQWGLWFLYQLAPESAAYNVALPIRVNATVDLKAMERTLARLAARHAVLRTTYETTAEGPRQRVNERQGVALEQHDVPGVTDPELFVHMRRSYLRPFDLQQGPVARLDIFSVGPQDHVLLLVVHHIATDLWSMAMLLEELQQLYREETGGESARLAPLPTDYAGYVRQQKEMLAGARGLKMEEYWLRELQGGAQPLELPADFSRPPVWTFRGAVHELSFGPELAASLRALARTEGKTIFAVMLAAWQTLLHRYTGRTDIMVGTPMSGRTQPDHQRLSGYLVNFVVMRGDLEGDPTFSELQDRLYRKVLGALEHQDFPFHRLSERLGMKPDSSRPQFIEAGISVDAMLRLPGLGAGSSLPGEPVPFFAQQDGQLDVHLHLVDTGYDMMGALRYAADLFTPETAARMVTHLRRLLEGIVRNPSARLSELPLMGEDERRRLLVEWNDSSVALPPDPVAHHVFHEQVERTPDALALVSGEESLTYRQLQARMRQLGGHLRSLGVGADSRVAVCVERGGFDLVVAMLATLEAGGAFLPLDPAHPPERLAYLLQDSAAQVLLTHSAILERLPEHEALSVCLDVADEVPSGQASILPLTPDALAYSVSRMDLLEAEHPALSPDDLAYVIYTSGSTGRPKGTLLHHRGLVNTALAAARSLRLAPGERALQLASPAFDASVWEVFSVLLSGATLVLAPREQLMPGEELQALLASQRITTVTSTPTVLSRLQPESLPALRTVASAGEALPPTLARRWGEGRLLLNAYGPTETTVCASVTPGPVDPERITIGRPFANTRLYVLDAGLRPLPVGVPGELYIGGVGVALGYLNRPELTAERFLTDPFSTEPRARLYRTGDRARWLPDGELEYLGRIDFQVKLRGLRIELGEIEAALLDQPSVHEAVVLVREDASGDPRLVAYVVPKSSASLVVEDATPDLDLAPLRAALKQRLPEYMVPSAFVVLGALPLSPTGKLDRKALPAPAAPQLVSADPAEAPRTPVEQLLADAFAEVLSLPRVGVNDDFFALGGHSLLATRVVSRIRSSLGITLALRGLFEAPTVAMLARHLQAAATQVRLPALVRASREGSLPLSFAQQRLWFVDQLIPGDAAYNIPAALWLSGALDVESLRRAFEELVRRHEVLRTTFTVTRGVPAQLIHAPSRFELPVVEVSTESTEESRAEALRLCQEDARQPFSLSQGPLLRASLLKLGTEEHVLRINMQHSISDGWSVGVLVRELAMLYGAFQAERPSPLPELAVQYADYAVWQRDWLQGEVLDTQLAWWKEQLQGLTPLELPTDFARPAVRRQRGGMVGVAFPKALADDLQKLARQEGATLFMVLVAGFQVLLARYSGQQDVTVGTPIAGRGSQELESLLGVFVNTLVLRARMEDRPTFRTLLSRVKDMTLGAFAHQDIPFEKLVEALEPTRDLSRQPLFQVMFALQNAPMGDPALPGLSVRLQEIDNGTSKFDFTLSLMETAQGLGGYLNYDADLFEAATMERLVAHYQRLLEGICRAPQQRVDTLELMTDAELREVLVDWNATSTLYPADASVHALFEAQADRTPSAVAVVAGDVEVTYAELEQRANQLARRLVDMRVGPEVRVGVCLERSVDLVVAMLAILKAGGAYVPLDPAHPAERLAYMLADSGVPILLTHGTLGEGLDAPGILLLNLDTERPVLGAMSHQRVRSHVTPDGLAYIIYTSGSTGRPKGVAVHHQAILRLVMETDYVRLTPEDRVAQLSNTSFDAATFEVWGALLCGARLVLVPRDTSLVPADLAKALRDGGVTTLFVTTALFNRMAREYPEGFATAKQVLFGGEASDPEAVRRLLEAGPPQRLLHVYGPTETTTFATWHRVESVDAGARSIPIGRPIANTTGYVLDAALRPVPRGVVGELYLGGDGVARGYHERPELTAEKFVSDPFSTVPGARLYRTGDLVRLRASGAIEFIGRVDHQVKLRGFRIELGEIETALQAHPGVTEAVVLVRDEHGDRKLVAYLVAAEGQQPMPAELREHLVRTLPEYMLPAAFVTLPAWPLNANGKVDRKALPAPTGEHAATTVAGGDAPSTPVQQLVADAFAQVLGLPAVGLGDDFFALGGHSLLATRVVSRIRSSLGFELPLRLLFEASTPGRLAERIESLGLTGTRLPPLERASREQPLPLSFAQQRLWFVDQLMPGDATYNMPVALWLTGTLDAESLRRAFEALVHRHEVLRTTFAAGPDAGQPVQVIHPPARFELALEDLSSRPDVEAREEVQRRAMDEARRPFSLADGPLLRTSLLKLGEREHVLLLNTHHSISDGWSVGVLVRELGTLYVAFHAGQPSPLPELPVQYADYAVWQRGWLQGEVLDTQLSWWRQQLAGLEPLELPTDFPRPAVRRQRGATVAARFPRAVADGLKSLARQEGATLFMVLVAGFQVLLSRYSGQKDVAVGTPIAGRRTQELESLLGMFINSLVLRASLEGNPTFRELLARVKESTLGAYAHQDIPFEKLVEALEPTRDLSRQPLFQVMFALQNAPASAPELPDVSVRLQEVDNGTSKFDLTVSLQETADGLEGTFNYDADLFEAATLERMVEHFGRLLEGVVTSADQRVAELPLLAERERRQLVSDWNATAVDYPRDASLSSLFERQVALTPNAVALVSEETTITYLELEQRANQLARLLRGLGVQEETPVCFCLERGVELIVAHLAILKAGGFYVPLDASYPAERLNSMLEDIQAPVLVTQRKLESAFAGRFATTLCMDALPAEAASIPVTPPPVATHGGSTAYVMFTSGSTGRPKGVLVPHRGVSRLVLGSTFMRFGPEERMMLAAPVTFDASTLEIWGALLHGARLALAPPHSLSLEDLASLSDRYSLTTMWLTAALFEQMTLHQPEALARVSQVLAGGDTLPVARVREHLARLPDGFVFVNAYGPTENTTFTTCHRMTRESRLGAAAPLGGPIANTRVYILDDTLHPVPVGVPGELFCAGDGLAHGYLHRPELSAEKFIPDPFSIEPGARMYRTGDRARWLADGTVDFLGRVDFQVKVRGFRIEPGEVEAALRTHEGVREAVVMAREDVPGNKRLVAYVVPVSPQEGHAATVDTAALRTYLKQKLPEYMVPAAFVLLDVLPLSPNGKVDRKALPTPDAAQVPQGEYTAPRDEVEQRLADIWAAVLRLPRVGIHDNFFALGGDSILSLLVVSRSRQAGFPLTARHLFQHQTVAELAVAARSASALATIDQGPVTGPVPLTPVQRYFLQHQASHPHHFNQSLLLAAHQPLHLDVLDKALRALLAHHDALRLRFRQQDDGSWVQDNASIDEAPLRLEHHDLSALSEAERLNVMEAHATRLQASFDLSQSPLLCAALFNLGSTQRLLICVHHIVVDAVSWRVLLEDLQTTYQRLLQGGQPALPPKTTSFQTWAQKLQQYALSDAMKKEAQGWLRHVDTPPAPLPTDRNGPNTFGSARTVTLALDTEETRALLREVPTAWRSNLQDVLLTALARSLADWTGRHDVWVNLEGHGREDSLIDGADLSRTVGWLTAIYPVLLPMPRNGTAGDGLRAVRESLRHIPHHGVGHSILKWLGPDELSAPLRALPAPQVAFNYLGQLDASSDANAILSLANEPSGAQFAADALRMHPLEVNGSVLDGRLSLLFIYSENLHEQTTIEALAKGFLAHLRTLITTSRSDDAKRLGTADFPLASLTQPVLDTLLQQQGPAVEDLYPLSPLQQGLLFHTVLSPESGVYFEQLAWTVSGAMAVEHFRQAWQGLVDRTPILRTSFAWADLESPLQVVHSHAELPWAQLDWRTVPAAEQKARFAQLLLDDRARGFDLRKAPLMRMTAVRLAEDTWRFLWSHHHLLLDGWSLSPVLQDVFVLFDAVASGREPKLPTRPPYRDYIAWLQRRDTEADDAFWRSALQGFSSPTPLPADTHVTPPEGQHAAQHMLEVALTVEQSNALQAFARQHQLTLSTLMMAAWGFVLGRHSGEQDVVFGNTVAGRPPELPGAEAMVGLLINTLPVRIPLPAGTTPVATWLQALQTQYQQSRNHEHTPLVHIQSLAPVPRGTPLFESLLVFENYPIDDSLTQRTSAMAVRDVEGVERTNYPITATILPGQKLRLRLTFEEPRFTRDSMGRVLDQWRLALLSLAAPETQSLADVTMMDAEERHRVVVEWNATDVAFPSEASVQHVFHQQVERTPEAPALIAGDTVLTFRQLQGRARQLAYRLEALGLGAEGRVALCLERGSPDLVVAMLATLEAGGAFLPLDPAHPPERLAYYLEDSHAQVLLTHRALVDRLPAHGAKVLCLDEEAELLSRLPEAPPAVSVGPERLAYVIYTSGSTGRPKGTLLHHRGLVNTALAIIQGLRIEPGQRALQLASPAFDASVWEVFSALLSGATLVLAQREQLLPGEPLQTTLAQQHISVLLATPTALATLQPEALPELRTVASGGEACPPALARSWVQGRTFLNAYGPTEVTIVATMTKGSMDPERLSIGRAIPNTRLYVLDAALRPQPVGVPGDLYIGGVGVARGYLDRPELTAERFIPDPFSTEPEARLYRSGDRVRWREDGQLEYLGRIDFQVKLRGLRIELGEIEAALLDQPTVHEAVVLVREDAPGDKRLVAYVVPKPPVSQDAAAPELDLAPLRTALKQRLPEYMVPSAFVVLKALPLSVTGKLDKKALPAPDASHQLPQGEYAAPRDEVEQRLADIWAAVLRLPRVGVHDNFFALGGDSILSLLVVSRSRQAGFPLTARHLFQHQTVAELAVAARSASALATIDQGPVTGPVPLTPVQRYFLEHQASHPHHFNQSLLLAAHQPLHLDVLDKALRALLAHHDALRLRFRQQDDGAWAQDNASIDEAPLRLEHHDLSALPAEEQRRELEAHGTRLQASFDLSQPPLLCAALFNLGSTQRLLICVHHIVVDAVSWRVLLEDLQTTYQRLLQGGQPALPPKTTSFQTWAQKLQQYAQSDAMKKEAQGWLRHAATPPAPLPTDSSGPNTYASARTVTFTLDTEETRALQREVPTAWRSNLQDVLLTALAQALSDWTDQGHIWLDLEGHGREDSLIDGVDLSRTVGWFTSIYPVHLSLPRGGTAGDNLRAVRESLRHIPHHGVGFGILKSLGPDELSAPLRALPTPPVAFNYLGQLDASSDTAALLSFANEPAGAEVPPEALRMHPLEVSGSVLGGRLQLVFAYSENLHRKPTIEALAKRFLKHLRALITESHSDDAKRLGTADFPLASLTPPALDSLLQRYGSSVEDLYPLSPLQQGLLFHTLLSPESGAYFEQLAWTASGTMDVAHFRRAWQALIDRTPILRTGFAWEGLDAPLQVVHAHAELPWAQLDWRTVPAAEQKARFAELQAEDRRRGFDLRNAPLMRMTAVRLADDTWRFLWSHHHLLLDGWSLSPILQDVFTLFDAFASGRAPKLPARPLYRDYIAWLQRRDTAADDAFWCTTLQGFSAPTPLPADTHATPPAGTQARQHTLELPLTQQQSAALQAFARQHQLTLSTLTMAAWGFVLSRHAGEPDVVFGNTVAGRPPELPGAELMVGLLINTVPVRIHVPVTTTPVATWLQALREQQQQTRNHEHTPLVHVQTLSSVPRGTTLFESLLVFENYPIDESMEQRTSAMSLKDVEGGDHTHYPLTATVLPGRTTKLQLTYEEPRFERESLQRVLEQWGRALVSLVAPTTQTLADVTMMSAEERQRVLVDWNATDLEHPRDASLASLFEQQAARTPDAVALISGEESLTFAQLEQRATHLAGVLAVLGVGAETPVGVCLERGIDLVVSLLAILKAGGLYVPLDPAYPRQRLGFILEDSGARLLLTRASLASVLPEHSARVLCVDSDEVGSGLAVPSAALPVVSSHQLAYLIYTSGSTGRPKAVAIEHRNAVAFLAWARTVFPPEVLTGTLAATSINFDLSVFELFLPLTTGGTVVMAENALALHTLPAANRVTLVNTVPSVMAELLRSGPLPESVRVVNLAGEPLPTSLVRQLYAQPGVWKVYDLYGPSETTTYSTYALRRADGPATIGRPIGNTRLYVLDEQRQPVPVGVPGELFIGGAGVARGYLGRPDLTAERFLDDPFHSADGERMYRTGDRVRWKEDGTLEYLGRVDFQVKVRGFRVEPGEVETVLCQHEGVREAVVVAREDSPGDKRLVGYVVAAATAHGGEPAALTASIRTFLQQKLPEHMVPSALVVLDALPLSPNGKVDRKALPAPTTTQAGTATEAGNAAHTPVQQLLADAFAEVLGLPAVGLNDDFFALGGHSLLATRVVSRIRASLGVELPLRALFEASTAGQLAERIEALGLTKGPQLPPLVETSREQPLPLSFAQQRLWVLEQLLPGDATYNIPVALGLSGTVDVEALRRAFETVVHRHEVLRTTFAMGADGQPVQVIHPPARFTLPLEDLSSLPDAEARAEVQRRGQDEARQPFSLTDGPLLRASLLKLGASEHVLLLNMHHIVSDGWSVGVLVRELGALYAAFKEGQPSPLPTLPLQYADYAVWQRGWLQGEVLDAQRSWWRQQLAGLEPLELPTDFPRPAVRRQQGATVEFKLPRELSDSLRALGRQEGATLFMVLLAGFQALLSRYSGQKDLAVGTPIAGRRTQELEPLLGMFINTLVLRTSLEGAPTFRELLSRVKESTLGAYAHQDIPFEKLVEELEPTRDLSRQPLFQVMFVLQNAPMGESALPGVSVSQRTLDNGTSKFDLSVAMQETADGLEAGFNYDVDLFEAATIHRMAGHFQKLLEGLAGDPGQRVSELALLGETERRQVLMDWNATETEYARESCIHELFAAQAERTPRAVALMSGESRVTYAGLRQKVDRLARRLRTLGVGPDVRVGVSVERSVDMVVAMLAILEAGGAYLPLDPVYPAERLALMLEDSGATVLLTQHHLSGTFAGYGGHVVHLDGPKDDASRSRARTNTVKASPDDAAYVIYTSGSTGRPKGVVVPHRTVSNFFTGMDALLGSSTPGVWLAVTSISFDIHVLELLWTLCRGYQVVLHDEHAAARMGSAPTLPELLGRHAVTHLQCTPSFARSLVLAPETVAGLGALEHLLVGGEALPGSLARQLRSALPSAALTNMYGPTETTVWSSTYTVMCDDLPATVSIGRPIANTRLYVLDEHLLPVPVGVPGELFIAGEGVVRGYLDRPELTSERFMLDPFHAGSGARMYRTGDRVRRRANGTLDFLGRIDFQVKVRGFRIELGEVESALRAHPGVADTVVVVREDAPGDKRLVAYLVPTGTEAAADATALRTFLKERLPEYMVPSAFVVLEALPLTPNGKVNRRALPAPRQEGSGVAHVAPRDSLELAVARLFEEVLGARSVGIHDDFFTLGGHSLLAVRLMGLLRERTGRTLPLAALFQASTVEQLAALARREPAPWIPLVPIQPGGDLPPFFLVHPVGGGVLGFAELARQLGPRQPLYGLEAQGLDGAEPPLESILEMAYFYIEALRTVQPHGPYRLGGWSLGAVIAFEMARVLRLRGEEVDVVALIEPSPTSYAKGEPLPDASALAGLFDAEPAQAVGLSPEQRAALERVFTANLGALHAHTLKPQAGTVTLLLGADTQGLDEHGPARGWDTLAEHVDVLTMPGDHHSLLSAPYVERLATALAALLERARTHASDTESRRRPG